MTRTPIGAAAMSLLIAAPLYLQAQTPETNGPAGMTAAPSAYTPITGSERFKEFLKNASSPIALAGSAVGAGVGQWRDSPHEWSEGGDGYAFRYASTFGQHLVRQSLMYGAAIALHEDNRYVRSRKSGTKARIGDAIAGNFLARGDDGRRHVSVSRIVAFAGASLISRLWQPPSSRSLHDAGVNLSVSIGVSTGISVAREFWLRR